MGERVSVEAKMCLRVKYFDSFGAFLRWSVAQTNMAELVGEGNAPLVLIIIIIFLSVDAHRRRLTFGNRDLWLERWRTQLGQAEEEKGIAHAFYENEIFCRTHKMETIKGEGEDSFSSIKVTMLRWLWHIKKS